MAAVTAFMQPASCTVVWWGTLTNDVGGAYRQGVTCPQRDGKVIYDNNCFPTTTQPFSAGCPAGWSSTSVNGATIGCCPSRYSFVGGGCIMPLTAQTSGTYPVCRTDNQGSTSIAVVLNTGYTFYARPVYLTSPTPSATPTPIIVTSARTVTEARTIQASPTAVQASPRTPSLSRSSTTPTRSTTSTTSTMSATTSTRSTGTAASATNTSSPISPVPALSKGAIAGISVGVAALLLLLGAGLVFLLRRRKQKTSTQPAAITDNAYTDMKPELAATGAVLGTGYIHDTNKQASVQEKQGGVTAMRPTASSPAPPSELSATTGHVNTHSYPTSPATQHSELPSYAPGGQPYTYMAGGEMGATPQHPQYIENTGPCYPEAYAAPVSSEQARASRLAELEASQRNLEDRMARMRHMSALEEEHERMQAEIARLRNM